MPPGGARAGAGRPKGVANKRTAEAQAAAEASGITPLDYMLAIMRDESAGMSARMDMAKAAAPYVHAKLASIEHKGDPDSPIEHSLEMRWTVVDPKPRS